MGLEELTTLAKAARWNELEQQWLAHIEEADPAHLSTEFLAPLEIAVKADRAALAETMAWALLSTVKAKATPEAALHMARELLIRLPTGEDIRDEVLTLYRQTHADVPRLESWIERSGLGGGKSVKRALRFLDVGLKLRPGAFLLHRTDDEPAELLEADPAADAFVIRTPARRQTLTAEQVIDAYDVVDGDDFRILRALRPERIGELIASDPEKLVIGIARGHRNRIDRDELKMMLVPHDMTPEQWTAWWGRARDAIKKSKHLRIEGRSPMFILYEPKGMTLEEETWGAFEKADDPRGWLDVVEGYLRETRGRGAKRDEKFLERIQTTLSGLARKFAKHEPRKAFATALVIERLADEGLPAHAEAHGLALDMLKTVSRPAALVVNLPDAALWALALPEVRQALPDRWPEVYAEIMRGAPLSQLDALGKAVEEAGRGELIPPIVEEALASPAEYADVFLWVWRGPGIQTPLTTPPRLEMLTRILALVGTARQRTGQAERGADVNALRAKVRSALSAKDYAGYRELLGQIDQSMALAFRRQIERADGLGPVVQDEMMTILREHFPGLYAKAKVNLWDEEGVLYVTRAGLKARQAELDELVNVKMRENAKAIGAAAELGDLSENSEYKFALEERDLLRARVAQIQSEISIARVLEAEEIPDDHVSIGHRVHLRRSDGGGELTLTLLGPWESNLSQRIFSYQTPLARRVLGHRVGDSVTIALDGAEHAYTIASFEPAIDSAMVKVG
jgi:transcription elongation factor GreA